PLQLQEEFLAVEAPAVAAEAPAAVEHPVARDHDRDRVRAERVARGAGATGAAGGRGHALISSDVTVGDAGGVLQHPLHEPVAECPVELEVEGRPAALEVLVELAPDRVELAGR